MESAWNGHHYLEVSEEAQHDLKGQKNNHLKVAVRVRPRTKLEIEKKFPLALHLSPEDPQLLKVVIPSSYGKSYTKEMRFDTCLGEHSNIDDVMHSLGIYQLLDAVLAGHHVCILAYGPTGSGKTHTIHGNSEDCGVLKKSANYLLESLKHSNCAQQEGRLLATCLEVYNENVFDLLSTPSSSSPSPLSLRYHPEHGFIVQGSKSIHCPDISTLQMVNSLFVLC